jgi:pyridoxal phosphate enzyme (YggS family)
MSEKYPGIEWHFIGPLQSNKASPLIKHVGKNLKCVETVSTLKLAQKLDRAVEEFIKPEESESSSGGDAHRLHIFLQIDTSGEETKSGIDAQDAPLLATEIASKCPHLSVEGVMTIGAPGDFNCFDALVACRKNVAEALGCPPERLALSMGMSGDFEEAIKRGATTVRVGSTIFGERDYSKKS